MFGVKRGDGLTIYFTDGDSGRERRRAHLYMPIWSIVAGTGTRL